MSFSSVINLAVVPACLFRSDHSPVELENSFGKFLPTVLASVFTARQAIPIESDDNNDNNIHYAVEALRRSELTNCKETIYSYGSQKKASCDVNININNIDNPRVYNTSMLHNRISLPLLKKKENPPTDPNFRHQ